MYHIYVTGIVAVGTYTSTYCDNTEALVLCTTYIIVAVPISTYDNTEALVLCTTYMLQA